MDIYARLRQEHEAIRRLRDQLLSIPVGAGAARRDLLGRLRRDLLAHGRAEEQVFYRSMEEDDLLRFEVGEAMEEHRMAEGLLDALSHLAVDDERWTMHLEALKEHIERHMDEEENGLFKQARTLFDARRAETLEDRYREARQRLFGR